MEKQYNFSKRKKSSFYLSLCSLATFLFCSPNLVAQLTIPSGNSYTSTDNRPIGALYKYSCTLSVYTKNEMNIPTGSKITGVRYFVQEAYNQVNVPVSISLKNTIDSSLTPSTYTSMKSGVTQAGTAFPASNIMAGKWATMQFSSPFTYTGNDLYVMVDTYIESGPGQGTTDKKFRWHDATAQSQIWQSNLQFYYPGNGTVLNSKPNIQILYETPGVTGTLSLDYTATTMLENRSQQISVNRVGGSTGAVSVDYTTSNGTAIAGSDYNAVSGTLSWADGDMLPKSFTVTTLPDTILDNNETFTITLSNPTGTTINGISTGTVTVTDVLPPMSGTYTVGTGGNYSSLTNDAGLFQAINERVDGVSGPLTINIISDLTAETGQHTLKEIVGNHSVLIKPSGAPRTITGTTSLSLLKFLDTDNITINGSTTAATVNGCTVGGDPALRELTIQALNSTTENSAVIHFKSGLNGAKNNTIKNVNIIGSASCYGIAFSGNTSESHSAGTDNNGNKIENCYIKKARIGISSSGKNVDSPNIGTVITQNDLSSNTGFDKIRQTGVYIRNEKNPIISYNKVYVENYDFYDVAGLAIGKDVANSQEITSGGITGAMINNNIITGVRSVYSSGSTSAAGIIISGSYTGNPNIIQNNMISNISNQAKNPYVVAGIFVVGAVASTTKLYHNTISLSGNRGAESLQYPSYGIALSGLDPSVDMRNNIMTTTQIATGGGAVKTYAFGTASTTFDNLISDHNSFFSGGVQAGGFRSGSLANNAGTSYPTIAAWRTATSRDMNSVQVEPVFVSATDLHLDANSNPLIKSAGTPISTVTSDIDCQQRNALTPTIGADEITTITLGANELNSKVNFSFYPNPVKSILHIKNDSLINKVDVFTMTGQNVLSKTADALSAECNLSSLPSGIYLVKITSGSIIKSVKIIKE